MIKNKIVEDDLEFENSITKKLVRIYDAVKTMAEIRNDVMTYYRNKKATNKSYSMDLHKVVVRAFDKQIYTMAGIRKQLVDTIQYTLDVNPRYAEWSIVNIGIEKELLESAEIALLNNKGPDHYADLMRMKDTIDAQNELIEKLEKQIIDQSNRIQKQFDDIHKQSVIISEQKDIIQTQSKKLYELGVINDSEGDEMGLASDDE